ncbi:MAG: hypothetical protein ACOX79_05475 [Methanosarcina sp.]|nr:hypothetical protein [Dysgonamonadaceae bacterium]MDD4729794.1 hypothetical protein [Dysgonamonadaceae bacterium]
MKFFNFLLEPTFDKSLSEIGGVVLPVTGVLLGLVYTAHIYWLQGGFSKLEYTRNLLEDLLVAEGNIVLDLLIGASVISLFAIIESTSLISAIFYTFSLVFIIDLVRYTAEFGYIQTLFSSKYIPSNYGKTRAYIRKALNAGILGWLKPLFLFVLVIFYPLILSFDLILSGVLTLNNNSIIVFILASTLFSFLQVKSLLTMAFKVRKDIEKRVAGKQKDKNNSFDNQVSNWGGDKRKIEEVVVLECLESIEIIPDFKSSNLMSKNPWTSRDLTGKPVLDGSPIIHENGSCHLNLIVPYLEDDLETRKFIFIWTKKIFESLAKSKSGVHTYAASFFRKEKKLPKTHFALMRASRGTIFNLVDKKLSDEDFVAKLEGKFLNESIDEF